MKNDTLTVTISKAEYDKMTAEIAENKSYIAELTSKVEWLMEQFRLAKHRRFGASSEKTIQDNCDQLSLFNEAEIRSDILVPELELEELVQVPEHTRKRKNMVNADDLPSDLPVEIVLHDLYDSEKICPECNGDLHVMGREFVRRDKVNSGKSGDYRTRPQGLRLS
jgi:hypothetical protein